MTYCLRVLSAKSPTEVERELSALNLDPFSIRNIAQKVLYRLLLVERIGAREATILKQELRSVGGDGAFTCKGAERDCSTVSLILTGTDKQFRRMCGNLTEQAFGLPSLAADILRTLDSQAAPPTTWATSARSIDLSRRPCIMGILNVTPDSFHDGNRYSSIDIAVERAIEMQEQGADMVDIGGESTRPYARPVDQDEELRRIMPVLERLSGKLDIPISVDTFKAVVAQEALATGAEIVNDISGLTFDDRMAEVVASARAGLVIMHTRGRPDEMQKDTSYGSLLSDITSFLRNSLQLAESAGIEPSKIVIDPGIGFGKSVQGNLEILRKLPELSVLGFPILVGTSHKSFIGHALGRPDGDRLFGTAATVALALANGASIFRVHDVREMRDVADMAMTLLRPAAV